MYPILLFHFIIARKSAIIYVKETLKGIISMANACKNFLFKSLNCYLKNAQIGLLSGIKDIEHIAEWEEEAEKSIKGNDNHNRCNGLPEKNLREN